MNSIHDKKKMAVGVRQPQAASTIVKNVRKVQIIRRVIEQLSRLLSFCRLNSCVCPSAFAANSMLFSLLSFQHEDLKTTWTINVELLFFFHTRLASSFGTKRNRLLKDSSY